MGWCRDKWEAIQELDADEVFAYNTIKVVRVKDRYLGLTRYISMLAIFLYIVVYVLILSKKYLEIEVPIGTVSATVENPGNKVYPEQHSYCSNYDPKYGPQPKYTPQLECQFWDEFESRYPAEEFNSIVVATRVNMARQTKACFPPFDGCAYPWTSPKINATSIYTVAVETFTVWVQHNMQAQKFYRETKNSDYARAGTDMTGKLVGVDGKVIKEFTHGRDIVAVDDLLRAADVRLSDMSVAFGHDEGESLRHSGMIMYVVISYDNVNDASQGVPTYTFYATAIPGAESKVVETTRVDDTTRLYKDRHNVKVVFLIAGQIGRFNFQVMLIQLVSALGLLSVATLVVEILMLYCMPHSRFYREYKFQESVDFSDVRDAEEAGITDEAFAAQFHGDLAAIRGHGSSNAPLHMDEQKGGGNYQALDDKA